LSFFPPFFGITAFFAISNPLLLGPFQLLIFVIKVAQLLVQLALLSSTQEVRHRLNEIAIYVPRFWTSFSQYSSRFYRYR
jgi:hypothetical protein